MTWNQKALTRDFMVSFFAHTAVPCRLIVIDNGSSDGTGEYLTSIKGTETVKILLVLNSENKGFAGGMNQGLELTDAPYVCFANNDLIFTKGWLEEVISVFESNKKIGILNPNSNNLGAHPENLGKIDVFAGELQNKFKGVFAEMPFCVGFCMFIRREVIDKVGGLSAEFSPVFFEDTDYSLKALKAGYLIGVAKGSYVWHKEHASVDRLGKKKEAYFSKSRELFRKKWGKILRIIFVAGGENEIDEIIFDAINLARNGNYVWVAVRNLRTAQSDIFFRRNLIEHSGVRFFGYRNISSLIWKIMVKKKRYDAVITRDRFAGMILKSMKFVVFRLFDKDKFELMKEKGKA